MTSPSPMLAAVFDRSKAQFPLIVTPKIDGVRVTIRDGVAYTRSGKRLPNTAIQKWASDHAHRLNGVDGEIVVGKAHGEKVFSKTQSGAMRRGGTPEFKFHVFDRWDSAKVPYEQRRLSAAEAVRGVPNAVAVPAVKVTNIAHLDRVEAKLVAAGYEGAMARAPNGKYKFGRSNVESAGLLKIKRFSDAEARIVGFDELKRGGKPAGMLGSLQVERNGVRFSIGSGLTDADRVDMWRRQGEIVGKQVKFKHMESGAISAPRHPVFLGLRSSLDMDAPKASVRAGGPLAERLVAMSRPQLATIARETGVVMNVRDSEAYLRSRLLRAAVGETGKAIERVAANAAVSALSKDALSKSSLVAPPVTAVGVRAASPVPPVLPKHTPPIPRPAGIGSGVGGKLMMAANAVFLGSRAVAFVVDMVKAKSDKPLAHIDPAARSAAMRADVNAVATQQGARSAVNGPVEVPTYYRADGTRVSGYTRQGGK